MNDDHHQHSLALSADDDRKMTIKMEKDERSAPPSPPSPPPLSPAPQLKLRRKSRQKFEKQLKADPRTKDRPTAEELYEGAVRALMAGDDLLPPVTDLDGEEKKLFDELMINPVDEKALKIKMVRKSWRCVAVVCMATVEKYVDRCMKYPPTKKTNTGRYVHDTAAVLYRYGLNDGLLLWAGEPRKNSFAMNGFALLLSIGMARNCYTKRPVVAHFIKKKLFPYLINKDKLAYQQDKNAFLTQNNDGNSPQSFHYYDNALDTNDLFKFYELYHHTPLSNTVVHPSSLSSSSSSSSSRRKKKRSAPSIDDADDENDSPPPQKKCRELSIKRNHPYSNTNSSKRKK